MYVVYKYIVTQITYNVTYSGDNDVISLARSLLSSHGEKNRLLRRNMREVKVSTEIRIKNKTTWIQRVPDKDGIEWCSNM